VSRLFFSGEVLVTTLSQSLILGELSDAEARRSAAALSRWMSAELSAREEAAAESAGNLSSRNIETFRQLLKTGDPPEREYFQYAKQLQIGRSQIYHKLQQLREQGLQRFDWPDQG